MRLAMRVGCPSTQNRTYLSRWACVATLLLLVFVARSVRAQALSFTNAAWPSATGLS
jgi:hypothetical protein